MDFEQLLEDCTYVEDKNYSFIFMGGVKNNPFQVVLVKKDTQEMIGMFEIDNPIRLVNAQEIMRFKESLKPKMDAFYNLNVRE